MISIDDSNNETALEVYPNPTDGKFILKIKTSMAQKVELEIVSLNGESVYKKRVDLSKNEYTLNIDISHIAEGVYFIRLKNDKLNITKTITLVK